jgi:8-oxo-dGTP pyrophosphatase MutT (NUDIX family)
LKEKLEMISKGTISESDPPNRFQEHKFTIESDYKNQSLMFNEDIYVRCGAIIKIGSKYVIVKQRSSGKWGIPKGSLRYREDAITCILRELYEETNINVKNMKSAEISECYCLEQFIVAIITLSNNTVLPNLPSDGEIVDIKLVNRHELHQMLSEDLNSINQSGVALMKYLNSIH